MSTPRERLFRKLADPTTPAFEGAVALVCEECGKHLTWTNPPAPSVPTVCREHARPGALIADIAPPETGDQ